MTEKKENSTGNITREEKMFFMNLNSQIQELQSQNLENAKFLRGISRKIENEFEQLRKMEDGKEFEGYDDTEVLESLDRLEGLIKANSDNKIETDNLQIIESIKGLEEKFEHANITVDNTQIIESIKSLEEKINHADNNNEIIIDNLRDLGQALQIPEGGDGKVNESLLKLEESVRALNNEDVLKQINVVKQSIFDIDISGIMRELTRLEALISEINSNAVLAELDHLRAEVRAINPTNALARIETSISNRQFGDNTDILLEIKHLLDANAKQMEIMQAKVERISSMPTMIKSVLQSENDKNLKEIDSHISDNNSIIGNKIEGLKTLVGFSVWLSLLAAALLIVQLLGIL